MNNQSNGQMDAIADCAPSRELVRRYIKSSLEDRKLFDREEVERAFSHIFWCAAPGMMCAEMWRSLKFNSADPDVKEEGRIREVDPETKKGIDADIMELISKFEEGQPPVPLLFRKVTEETPDMPFSRN